MVIQRWQSLLLLMAAAVMGCFTFCSIAQIQTADYTFNFTSLGFYQEGVPTDGVKPEAFHTWYFFTVSLCTMLLYLIDIFLFKNLPLQKKVCIVGVLLNVAAGVIAVSLAYCTFENAAVDWSGLVIAPVISVVGALVAYGCMQRDHNRLRSVDRIR